MRTAKRMQRSMWRKWPENLATIGVVPLHYLRVSL
jgi:hypothetical protein